MFKYLIKMGAIITNPVTVIQRYLRYNDILIDEELLIHFLDAGLDLNYEYNICWRKTIPCAYILEYIIYFDNFDMMKLFLKYGADVRNNNYATIKIAIKSDEPKIISILLATIDITPYVKELLEQYDPDEKKLIY
jgi:hypothetical protein